MFYLQLLYTQMTRQMQDKQKIKNMQVVLVNK